MRHEPGVFSSNGIFNKMGVYVTNITGIKYVT